MKNKKLYVNYSFSGSSTAQRVWKSSDSSFNNYMYNSFEVCSLEKKVEHSNIIDQKVETVTTLQRDQHISDSVSK